jgi:hypothetical protein
MEIETWKDLIFALQNMTEQEVKEAINYEVSRYKRESFIKRMHQRYCILRNKSERDRLLKGETLL